MTGRQERAVLLSEGSSLTARETMNVLGCAGVRVEVVSPGAWPLAGFSRWCRAVHRVQIADAIKTVCDSLHIKH